MGIHEMCGCMYQLAVWAYLRYVDLHTGSVGIDEEHGFMHWQGALHIHAPGLSTPSTPSAPWSFHLTTMFIYHNLQGASRKSLVTSPDSIIKFLHISGGAPFIAAMAIRAFLWCQISCQGPTKG